MKWLFICGLICILGCSSEQKCLRAHRLAEKYCQSIADTIIHDTTIVTTIVRDTVITHSIDTFNMIIENPCNQDGTLKKMYHESRGNRGGTTVYTHGNDLVVMGVCDELNDRIELQDRIIDHYRSMVITNSYIKPELLNWWQKALQWLTNSMAVVGIAALAVLLFRLWK